MAYEEYYTHSEEEAEGAQSGVKGVLWRLINGYLNRRFGLRRSPAWFWGYHVFRGLPPFSLKLDYYGRHLYRHKFPDKGLLLDVGCGNGAFLLRAQDMGWSVLGLEPDEKAASVCATQDLEVFCGHLEDCPQDWRERFDVVTVSHALEHVPEPAKALECMFALLRKGGILWVALPNPQGVGARFFGRAWRELHPPYHLCIVSRPQLLSLLRAVGFSEPLAVRVGARSARPVRESAQNARYFGGVSMRMRAAVSPVIRLIADAAGTLWYGWGEETVIIARRPLD